jgi:hypothetical protein
MKRERRNPRKKKELAKAGAQQEEEEQEMDMQAWSGLMMLGDRLNPDGTIPNVVARNWRY